MKIETQKLKIVTNENSVNVITKENLYYAKGISRRRKLKGKEYTYKYIVI